MRDDRAHLLLTEERPACLGARVGALEVDEGDEVPVLFGHVLECLVTWCVSVKPPRHDKQVERTRGMAV